MWNHWSAMSEAMDFLGMAPPTFRGEQLADVFAYLFIARYDGQKGDLERGKTVYAVKGCASCHGEAGEGDTAPPLSETTVGESKELIVQRMWNHAPQMQVQMGEQRIAWPRFEAAELAALLAFLSEGWDSPSAPGRKKTGGP
jgi:mono/diheme cytochrome c family protein